MKLYVCYGTWQQAPYPGGHPCGNAYHALRDSGHDPDVVRTYGFGPLGPFNLTPGRRKVHELTGQWWVPMLVADDGEVVNGSQRIVEWARAHPAGPERAAA
jgi:hypothetical protein